MNTTHPSTRTRRASATIELLVLLPVLVLILFAMLYLGELSVYKTRAQFGAEYALDAEGDQSEQRAVRGEVTDLLYPNRIGELTVIETEAEPAEVPEPGEIRDLFDDMCQPIYSTTAVGRYVIGSDGRLRFIVTTQQNRSLGADGRYVERYDLQDDHIPDLCTELLQGWMERRTAELTYSYAPEYIDLRRWALEPADLPGSLKTCVRLDRIREVTDPPPGMNHQVDTLTTNPNLSQAGQLPHYPDFSGDETFWEAN
jgi:hypothetical protein